MDARDNPTPISKDNGPVDDSVARTTGQKVSEHIDAHKVKYIIGLVLTAAVTILQAWPTLCPVLPGKLNCAKIQVIGNAVVNTVQTLESLDAGN